MSESLRPVLEVLPHGPRVCYLSKMTELVKNEDDQIVGARGYYDFPTLEQLEDPSHPHAHLLDHVRPAVLLGGNVQAEAVALAGSYAALHRPEFAGKFLALLHSDHVPKRPVRPGDRLDIEVSLHRLGRFSGYGSGIASVNGETACVVKEIRFGVVGLERL